MAVLRIVTAPNPILSGSSKKIGKIDKNVLKLIEEMEETLLAAKDPEGVGLAAPQVGKSLRLFITKPTPKSPIHTFINPVITQNQAEPYAASNAAGTFDGAAEKRRNEGQRSSALAPRSPKDEVGSGSAKFRDSHTKLEGCLSLPSIWGEVTRIPSVTLSYLDRKGKSHTRTFKGLFSIIVQHEVDHLNGILFPKRILEQNGKLYKSHKDEKGEDVFEEIEL